MRFTAAQFVVTFDDDVTLSGTGVPLSQLPLTTTQMDQMSTGPAGTAVDGGGGDSKMPDAMFMQMGAARLRCPCVDCAGGGGEFPECSGGTECVYESTMDPMAMMQGPPPSLLPMPSAEEATAVLFSVFASQSTDDAVPKNSSFTAIKILRNWDEYAKQWTDYIPAGLGDMSGCVVEFYDATSSPNGVWFSGASDNSTMGGAQSPASTPYAPLCTEAGFSAVKDELRAALETIDSVQDGMGRAGSERVTWNVARFQMRDAYVACTAMVANLVTTGAVNKTFPGTKRCFHAHFSDEWLADPCCSDSRRFTECCVARPITHAVTGVVGVDTGAVAAQCAHPAQSEGLMNTYVRHVRDAAACDAMAKDRGADYEVVQELASFQQTCHEELFGKNGPPTCKQDTDCWTSCDKAAGQCIMPHDNPTPYFLACMKEYIDPKLKRAWNKEWGLTGESSDAEFDAKLQEQLYSLGCVGPTGWEFNERWESETVPSCPDPSDHECFCWDMPAQKTAISRLQHAKLPIVQRIRHMERLLALAGPRGWAPSAEVVAARTQINVMRGELLRITARQRSEVAHVPQQRREGINSRVEQCMRHFIVPGNQTLCEADASCNWNRDAVDANACNDNPENPGTTHFCGQCHGDCWEVSRAGRCETWVADAAACTATGGTQGPWGNGHCVFPGLSSDEDACLPPGICPPRPDASTDLQGALGNRWCEAGCYSTAATNQTECDALGGQQMSRGDTIALHKTRSILHARLQRQGRLVASNPNSADLRARLERTMAAMTSLVNERERNPLPPMGGDLFTQWDAGRGECRIWNLWGQECANYGNTTWFPGRSFEPGRFADQSTCEAGRCSVDERMSADECTTYASCTQQCGRCRPQFWGNTLCYAAVGVQNETQCAEVAGEWDLAESVCVHDIFRTQAECGAANANYTWAACEDLAREQCGDEMASPLDSFARGRLQCYNNPWDSCESEAECATSGQCDDWELENWFNPACFGSAVSNADAAKAEGCTGVCVAPFDLSRGWPECGQAQEGQNVGWARIGCIRYDITDAATCANITGAAWRGRAFDEATCTGHGQGCDEKRFWQLSPKQGAVCTDCDGTVKPFYKWLGGAWVGGEMQPLSWRQRQFDSVNEWKGSLDWNKLYRAVEKVALQLIAKSIKSAAMCKYNLVTETLSRIACDCGDVPGANCYDDTSFVAIGEEEFFSGIDSSVEWAGADVTVPADAIDPATDSEVIMGSAPPDLDALLASGITARRMRGLVVARSPEAPNQYEVVTNANDAVVGQLVGSGISLTLGNLTNPINVCIDVDQEITRDTSTYPEADLAVYDAGAGTFTPMGQAAVVNGDYVQVCADVLLSATYFPVLRMANGTWEAATTGAAPATTTTTTTTTTTAALETTVAATTTEEATTVPATTTEEATTVPATTTAPANSSALTAETGDCCPGYGGTECLVVDKCHGVACNNGGTCDTGNGLCACASGYAGPTCSYLDCGGATNGLYNPLTGACMCMPGWGGVACGACGAPTAAAHTYLCIPSDPTTYLLVPIANTKVGAYLSGDHRAVGSPTHPPVYPNGVGHDGATYDCGCHRVAPGTKRNLVRLTPAEVVLFNDTIVDCIDASALMMSEMDALNDLWARLLQTEVDNTVSKLTAWLIIVSVVGGVVLIGLLATCMVCCNLRRVGDIPDLAGNIDAPMSAVQLRRGGYSVLPSVAAPVTGKQQFSVSGAQKRK